jgi:hypothetical protein
MPPSSLSRIPGNSHGFYGVFCQLLETCVYERFYLPVAALLWSRASTLPPQSSIGQKGETAGETDIFLMRVVLSGSRMSSVF